MRSLPQIPFRGEDWLDVATIVDAQNRIRHLGRELRLEFDPITHEPLPHELVDLLRLLDEPPHTA